MNKIILTTMLILALVFGYSVVKSGAHEMMEEGWWMTHKSSEQLGAIVNNRDGEFLGIITDFVSDPDGRISFAILLFGNDGDYGEGGRQVAVPFGALSWTGQDYLLDSSYSQLASSPVFIFKDELVDRSMAENVYRYFGVQPDWTDEESTEYEVAPDVPSYDDDY